MGAGNSRFGAEASGSSEEERCFYTGSVASDRWAGGGGRADMVGEAEGGGGGLGTRGGLGVAEIASSTTDACSSSLLRKCERLIRMPSCQRSRGFFLGC